MEILSFIFQRILRFIYVKKGRGTITSPYQSWHRCVAVRRGEWWFTEHCGLEFLFSAKKDGIPNSGIDDDYWDILAYDDERRGKLTLHKPSSIFNAVCERKNEM